MKAILDALPTVMGQNERMDAVIESVLKEANLEEMARLSNYMKIKIKFSLPVSIRIGRRYKESNTHTFVALFEKNGNLYYKQRRTARTGRPISTYLIESWEPIPRRSTEFRDYQEFAKKIDRRFMDEKGIKDLWNSKSGQHGGQYRPNDFRKLSKTGIRLVKEFMHYFNGIDAEPSEGYRDVSEGDNKVLSRKHYSTGQMNSQFGRDITVSHQTNIPRVYWSSEYPGCGNGRYGLLVNEREYLWLEDD